MAKQLMFRLPIGSKLGYGMMGIILPCDGMTVSHKSSPA